MLALSLLTGAKFFCFFLSVYNSAASHKRTFATSCRNVAHLGRFLCAGLFVTTGARKDAGPAEKIVAVPASHEAGPLRCPYPIAGSSRQSAHVTTEHDQENREDQVEGRGQEEVK